MSPNSPPLGDDLLLLVCAGERNPPLPLPPLPPPSELLLLLGIVRTVRRRSYSAFRDMIVVISLTVMRLTSSPSIATMRSPGEIRSTRTLEVRTPDTTVPFESALLARIIPSFPGGATIVILDRRTTEEEFAADEDDILLLLDAFRLADRADARDIPPKLALLDPTRVCTPCTGIPSTSRLSPLLEPTIASCISNLNKSFATLLLCSDICDKKDLVDR